MTPTAIEERTQTAKVKVMPYADWMKVDLHIHTPESHEQYYTSGLSKVEAWEKFIDNLEKLPPDVKVIGINDYWHINGYNKVMQYKKNDRLQNLELILPVIEFRTDDICYKREKDKTKETKLNFHVIFSNTVDTISIEDNFVGLLKCTQKDFEKPPKLNNLRHLTN
jgi:hypothetical protein